MNKILQDRHQNILWQTVSGNYEVYKTMNARFYIVANNTITDTLHGDGFMKEACLSLNQQKLIYLSENMDLVLYDFTSKTGDTIRIPELAKQIGFEFSIPRDVLEQYSGSFLKDIFLCCW